MSYTIECRTNIDNYKGIHVFPKLNHVFPKLNHVPRIGETINVDDDMRDFYLSKQLPTRLEVIDVVYGGNRKESKEYIIVELHYKKIDIQIAEQNKINLF